ncbi:thioredoxin domain-containing protein [Mycobacterium yunnanensis]|uniref:Thioredoxin domain-containing protein n=1 Tax=Mycobacterium yunnanensis TaxID=368477 RepID=A0A9X2Z1S1_9MYCO|nr:thioredoxin domain-containing protein [Mycobacterium yunnanensis]MCV7421321.1 thioredoxin domain-containing protein [Mycobacterium yunnanensis]
MRSRQVVVAVALSLALVVSGCTRAVAGTPLGDTNPPRVAVTEDSFGIRAGSEDAPVQLEIYTEPQCTHCADLQHDFGDEFAYYIGTGQLAITYRPMTFLDGPGTSGHSARVANALFVAADEGQGGGAATSATGREFQRFVQQLWAHQEPGGAGPDDATIAEFARTAGLPDYQVRQLLSGATEKSTDDLAAMESTNFGYLYEVDPVNTRTPTVFDLHAGKKVEVYDDDWLTSLMES